MRHAAESILRRLGRYGPVTYLGVAVAVFVLAVAAVALAPPDTKVAAWWPAAGLSAIAIAWAPRRRRLLVVLTVAVASAVANGVAGRTPALAAAFGVANALEAWTVAWWITRNGRRPSLRTLDDVSRLLAAALLGAVVMGATVALTVGLIESGTGVVAARTVMASHAAAVLVTVPLGMQVRSSRAPGRRLEAVVQWFTLVAAALVIFSPAQPLPLSFMVMPALVWGAFRLGVRTVSLQLLTVGVVVTWLTRTGGGPFASHLGAEQGITTSLVQVYLVVAAVIVLPLAVSVAQRRAALERVTASERIYRLGFDEALLGTLLLRRCDPAHVDAGHGGTGRVTAPARTDDGGGPHGPAPIPDPHPAPPDGPARHAGGGLDVVELNAVAERILGTTEHEAVGTSWTGRLDLADQVVLEAAVADITAGRLTGWHGELLLLRSDDARWVEVSLSPLPPSAGEGLFVAQLVDVTARRAAEERLTAQALQDSLTGLGNRTLLGDRVDLALRSLGNGDLVGVLYCDLDDFKLVNDSTGHSGGDVVLVEVARRIRGLLGPDDVAARLGGDEFVVLRSGLRDAEEAEALARDILDALVRPTHVSGRPFSVGASIGIALGGRGARAEDLLRDADAAMYVAKSEGKRRAVVYSDEHRARAVRVVRLEAELRRALEGEELEVHLQPVVNFVDGTVVAAEALVRWRHPDRGLLAPGEWLDVAEDSGLMPQVGAWVLERACAEAVAWPEVGGQVPKLHVNVSARQLDETDFVDVVQGVLERTGLAPQQLVLEFTETHLDAVSDDLLRDLEDLRASGIGLAADDYGTGYSPLTRIIELPISMIKIDLGFVSAMLDDVRSGGIVTALVSLGESLGLEVVAEGVETDAQAEALRALGCTTAQGYLWSRPLQPGAFVEYLG